MRLFGALALALAAGTAAAHDGHRPAAPAETAALPAPFPAKIGGAFRLTDQRGEARTEADPAGRLQLLFFGYANCEAICAVALPLMAEVTENVRAKGVGLVPVLVTVDPARDSVAAIGPALARHHPDFVGLTGTEAELAALWRLFGIETAVAFGRRTGRSSPMARSSISSMRPEGFSRCCRRSSRPRASPRSCSPMRAPEAGRRLHRAGKELRSHPSREGV
ncbi:MAG TPA: SCO family protein [Paracoccaceae bacterium]|nr:SCO family protein [Paracoccaceae bacterium]